MSRARLLLLLVVLLPACVRVLPTYNVPPVILGEPSFFPTLEAYTQSPIVGGNRVDILLNGDEIFPTLIQSILATVGSTNLDNRSFALNEELNLTVYDAPTARRLEQIFEDDLKGSTRVTYRKWSGRGIVDRFLELLTVPIRDQL